MRRNTLLFRYRRLSSLQFHTAKKSWVDKNADPSVQIAAETYSAALEALTHRQEKSVENGVPTARVIVLASANHYVFLSNEAEVLKDIDAFLTCLH